MATGSATVIFNTLPTSSSSIRQGTSLRIFDAGAKYLLTAPYAPKEIDYTSNGVVFSNVTRPNLAPITVSNGVDLKKMTFTLYLADKNIEKPVDDLIKILEYLSNTDAGLVVEYEPRTSGFWNMTALTYTSVERQLDTNRITRCNANLEFTEAVGFINRNANATSDAVFGGNSPQNNSVNPVYGYTVKPNEILATILKKHKMTLKTFAKYNPTVNPRKLPKVIKLKK